MGSAYKRLPEYRETIEFQEKALEIFCRLGNGRDEAACLDRMALLCMLLGDYDKAVRFHELALEESPKAGGAGLEGESLHRAIHLYEKALEGLCRVRKLTGG